jgi:jmjN domain
MSTDVSAGGAPLPECRLVIGSPPENTNAALKVEPSDSELSDIEEEEDIGEVIPDHEETGVPVFKPTMEQFRSFKLYVSKILVHTITTKLTSTCR